MSTSSPTIPPGVAAVPAIVGASSLDSRDVSWEATGPLRRFSVAEYQRMARAGILTEDDRVELLEGIIVEKMPKYPPHDGMIDLLIQLLQRHLPLHWFPRCQNTLVTGDSQPEPDVVVTRGEPVLYMQRHPTAADVALVIEVADSSLARDRRKRRIYARAGVPQYWIVNLNTNQIEKHADPDRATAEYRERDAIPLASPVGFTLPEGGVVTLPFDTALQTTTD